MEYLLYGETLLLINSHLRRLTGRIANRSGRAICAHIGADVTSEETIKLWQKTLKGESGMRSRVLMCCRISLTLRPGRQRVSSRESVVAEPCRATGRRRDRYEHQRGAAAQRTHARPQQTQNAQRPHLAPQELLPPARATTHQACQVSHKNGPFIKKNSITWDEGTLNKIFNNKKTEIK